MRYIKTTTNKIYSIDDVRAENPNVSITDGVDLSEFGYAFLIETPAPAAMPWHYVTEGAPVDNMQTWVQTPMSVEEITQVCSNAVQSRLDAFAKTRNYDGIMSACTYAASSNLTFKAEGQRCADLRDDTWATCYLILNQVMSGNRTMPSLAELFSELPALSWSV